MVGFRRGPSCEIQSPAASAAPPGRKQKARPGGHGRSAQSRANAPPAPSPEGWCVIGVSGLPGQPGRFESPGPRRRPGSKGGERWAAFGQGLKPPASLLPAGRPRCSGRAGGADPAGVQRLATGAGVLLKKKVSIGV
jgi:hypothetical protein